MTTNEPPTSDLQRSSRDLELVRKGLERALAAHIPEGTDHEVGRLEGTSATGMSSETLLFDASWREAGGLRRERLVARVAPDLQDVPVFPTYDLPGQFRTIQTVGELTDVPVPPTWWCEPDPAVIGSPFFVMGRVDGEVPPDIPFYNMGESWVSQASEADQRRLQDSSVSVLARLHAIEDPEARFPHLAHVFPGDTALRQHVEGTRRWYEFAAHDCGRSDLVEKGFAFLEEHWPQHEGPAVLSWGDSRIGNMMYRDFEPVAVFDWEMASIGPRELDVGWMLGLHAVFEGMVSQWGFEGMPHFLQMDDVASTYEVMTGYELRDLKWYVAYTALQMGIVFLRTGQRSVRFGETQPPANADDLLFHAATLNALITG
jgi:aminoglycoside phosphotransferase (APT) family kinase protein